MLFLVFSAGNVTAKDPTNKTTYTNLTDNVTNDSGLNPVNPSINNTDDIINNNTNIFKMVNLFVSSELEKRDIIIHNQDLRIEALENTVNNQSAIINSLKADNVGLKDNNTQLDKRVKELEDSNKQRDKRIEVLENDNKDLKEDTKALREDNIILKAEIDDLKLENKNLHDKLLNLYEEKDKLNDQYLILKDNNKTQYNEIQQLKDKIDNLNHEIKNLKDIIEELKAKQVSYGDVHKTVNDINGHIKTCKYNPEIITCGKNKFKLNDFLNLNLIHDGKERALLFKEKQGVLPLYVVVAGVQLDLPVYKIFYNI